MIHTSGRREGIVDSRHDLLDSHHYHLEILEAIELNRSKRNYEFLHNEDDVNCLLLPKSPKKKSVFIALLVEKLSSPRTIIE